MVESGRRTTCFRILPDGGGAGRRSLAITLRRVIFLFTGKNEFSKDKIYRDDNLTDRFVKQRMKMVDTQIRARGIADQRVLKAMEKIPRHLFVDEGLIDQAYYDSPLPIDRQQTISQPYIVALRSGGMELAGAGK